MIWCQQVEVVLGEINDCFTPTSTPRNFFSPTPPPCSKCCLGAEEVLHISILHARYLHCSGNLIEIMNTKSENSPLIGLDVVPKSKQAEKKNNAIWTLVLASTCVLVLVASQIRSSLLPSSIKQNISDLNDGATSFEEEILSKFNSRKRIHQKPRYTKVQTLSFQIYTGGAPAYTDDGEPNEECINLNDYGVSEDDNPKLQCYLGLDETSLDVERRLNIMSNAVNRAYDVSDQSDDTLKVFMAPEFYFRGKNGAYEFINEEENQFIDEEEGKCSAICQILRGLENMVAQKRFDNWLFLFGTVIGSESEYIHLQN